MLNQHLIAWEAPEYLFHKKTTGWYTSVMIIAGGLAIAAFISGSFSFGILSIIGGVAMVILGARHPDTIDITITTSGIHVGPKKYPWKSLHSFWILIDEKNSRILISQAGRVQTQFSILLADADPEMVHQTLSRFLDEEEQFEPVAQRIMDRLGF